MICPKGMTTHQHPWTEGSHACIHFLPLIRNRSIKILIDNIACMFCSIQKVGIISPSLCAKAVKLKNRCIAKCILILAAYFPGIQNRIANDFSRHFSQDYQWMLDSQSNLACLRSSRNRPLCHYDQQEMPTLLLKGRIGSSLFERCLPCSMAKKPSICIFSNAWFWKMINKIRHDKARIILIVPTWLRHIWYPYLIHLAVYLAIFLPKMPLGLFAPAWRFFVSKLGSLMVLENRVYLF